jgi:hypothetical protein
VDPAELRELAYSFKMSSCQLLPTASRLAILAGDVDSARSLLGELEGLVGVGEHGSASEVVRACLEAGVPQLGERFLANDKVKFPLAVAGRRCAEAMLAEAKGDYALGREGYVAVLETWRELGVVLEQAYTLAGLGRCLLALEETDGGVARLKEARALWVGMKASRRIAEIDELMKSLV